jgi:hypothetical protein
MRLQPRFRSQKVSEEQTCSREDTRVLSFKVLLGPARRLHLLTLLPTAQTAAVLSSEAERIVFAAEGLLLAHDFPFQLRNPASADILYIISREIQPLQR